MGRQIKIASSVLGGGVLIDFFDKLIGDLRKSDSETTIQIDTVRLQEELEKRVTGPNQSPVSQSQPIEFLVKSFGIRSIQHEVTLGGVQYRVRADNFDWLDTGTWTFANISISSSGSSWRVEIRTLLTNNGKANDIANKVIGAFANAGLAVSRRVIDACMLPIQKQVLEVEQLLKNFE